MSLYTVELLKSMRQLHQSKSKNEDRLILRRLTTALDIVLFATAILLIIPTHAISLLAWEAYFWIKEFATKTYLVQNMSTGEKFRMDKKEFKLHQSKNRQGKSLINL
ncbi:hypothetical protein IEQ_04816 [Bacillus cereus BAG6X1-2]|nr:hypothetical protein IEQ_04816 [Bacillus cereus BAG6X1-2]